MQIIKQRFHSFIPPVTHHGLGTHSNLPRLAVWPRISQVPSLDLSCPLPLNGAYLSGLPPFLSDECALSLPCSTGTTERVCLVQGTAEALNAVHSFIAEKVREIPQAMTKPEVVNILQPQTTMNPDRAKQVSWARECVAVGEVSQMPAWGFKEAKSSSNTCWWLILLLGSQP